MKSMTKLMVVAMILVAALVVAPVAARTVNVDGETFTIEAGDIIYVGEENLNFDGTDFPSLTRLVHFSDVSAEVEDNFIMVTQPFNLNAADVDGIYGTYYANTVEGRTVVIRNPSVALDVVLAQDEKSGAQLRESIAGKSVTRANSIVFKLTNNLVGFADVDTESMAANNISIDVTLPGGGVTRSLNGTSLANINANGTAFYSDQRGDISLAGFEPGTYTAQAKWISDADFYGKGFDSNTVTFEVATKSLAITANKDSIVRGNSFTVTVTGESLKDYDLFIKDEGSLAPGLYPFLVENQAGVTPKDVNSARNASVKTNAAGTRTVQFNTDTATDDRQFTIRVQDPGKLSTYDEVKVRVEKGSVTITASGTGVYYIGEEITLSGTCTDNASTVHLFMTGPNLANDGVKLEDLERVVDDNTDSFTTADVEGDDTWSFKWNTGATVQEASMDSGGYTIYAVSKPVDKRGLSSAKYATASIQLRSGFITATSSGAVVAKGDDLTLTGTAQGDPGRVNVWVFGKNLQVVDSATVDSDGSFEYDSLDTTGLTSGQYFVVIQHPMMDKEFGVEPRNTDPTWDKWIEGREGSDIGEINLGRLQASDAATALINALDSPNVDDTYVKLTFVVEEAQIFIDAIGDKAAGSTFTITGTTNLAVGDTLNIEVTSAAFQPTSKSEASGFGSVAGTTEVMQGDGANTWSFEVDGASFKPDQYIVNVESIETSTTATATFNVVEAVPTTQTTPTTTATGEVTPTETATTEATPTQSPGFGALLALAGLGAVAFLVLRRD
ncbi:hypothetical protein DSECCO2_36210 [anaerobic digester metagenome]